MISIRHQLRVISKNIPSEIYYCRYEDEVSQVILVLQWLLTVCVDNRNDFVYYYIDTTIPEKKEIAIKTSARLHTTS